MQNYRIARQYGGLIRKQNVPADRVMPSVINASWFLRHGILYCKDRKQYDELVVLAKVIANE